MDEQRQYHQEAEQRHQAATRIEDLPNTMHWFTP
jgi:hypothetical protein